MRTTLLKIFARRDSTDVAREQLFEAERLALEHQAAGELHSGLAAIYKQRAERLRQARTAKLTLELPTLVTK